MSRHRSSGPTTTPPRNSTAVGTAELMTHLENYTANFRAPANFAYSTGAEIGSNIKCTLQDVGIGQGKKILLSVVCKVLVYQTLLYHAIQDMRVPWTLPRLGIFVSSKHTSIN